MGKMVSIRMLIAKNISDSNRPKLCGKCSENIFEQVVNQVDLILSNQYEAVAIDINLINVSIKGCVEFLTESRSDNPEFM